MFFNIIIFFIILILLILQYRNKEGFELPAGKLPDIHDDYVTESQIKYDPVALINDATKPAIPFSSDNSRAMQLALGVINATPTSSTYSLNMANTYSMPQVSPETLKMIEMCEKKQASCDAFDNDPEFAENCGISFDILGKNSAGKTISGGLFVSSADRKAQNDAFNNVKLSGIAPYDPYKVFYPTVGTAKQGSFGITKNQCLIVKEKIDCEDKQTFTSANCTQCYTSGKFSRVDPTTQRMPSTLYLYGVGTASVTSTPLSGSTASIAKSGIVLNTTTASTVTIPNDSEGITFTITVPKSENISYIAGYLEGTTARGVFKIDLINFVKKPSSKYKLNGTLKINTFKAVIMAQTTVDILLDCLMPFSFLNKYDTDTITCDNGPIITKPESATFLESNPCYGKDNKPGNYKLECLQDRWLSLGGTTAGEGYPSDQAKADALQKDLIGNPLGLDDIIENIYFKMKQALSGVGPNGPLSIPDWNTLSMWGTGVKITNACDGPNMLTGPLSQDCLSYLYKNSGAPTNITYKDGIPSLQHVSMKGQDTQNTYCYPGTSIDPSTPEGLQYARTFIGNKGVNEVKSEYDKIYKIAINNDIPNKDRRTEMKQCFGINIKITEPQGVFICASGLDNYIYYCDTKIAQEDMTWEKIPGGVTTLYTTRSYIITNLSIAPSGFIVTTNSINHMYYLDNYKNTTWKQFTYGSLKQISTDGTKIVGIDNASNLTGRVNIGDLALFGNGNGNNWKQVVTGSKVKKIVTVGGYYYCIGMDDKIYYTISITIPFITILQWIPANPSITNPSTANTFTDIAIDDILVLVGTDKKLYYNNKLFSNSVNTLVPNQPADFKAVSVSRGTIYALDTSGNPWYTPHYINTSWIQMNGTGDNKQGALEYISHRITVA